MALLNQVMVEVIHIAERGLVARQDASNVTSLEIPSSTISTPTALTTPSSSIPSPTQSGPSSSGNAPSTSSPLLFFVALGFGVVFTNLWIIVGVKYCFRYNARNRALRNGEDLDVVNLDNMPTRPHRRRREKKLMTMDDVNERFPLTKYKNWMASRASQGLPTAGGVSSSPPPSRPTSLRNADGVMPTSPVGTKHSVNTRPPTAASDHIPNDSTVPTNLERPVITSGTELTEKGAPQAKGNTLPNAQTTTTTTVDRRATVSEEDDDDDDHIHTAVPPELLTNPGDACAICIDTLEDDDDIRGLTCGHAFHAGCLDPWLTSRRACCPLCKADYYVPKPRPEGEPVDLERLGRRRSNNTYLPEAPRTAWVGNIRGTRLILPGRFLATPVYGTDAYGRRGTRRGRRSDGALAATAEAGNPAAAGGAPAASRWRPRIGNPFSAVTMPTIRFPGRSRGGAGNESHPVAAGPTPSALEAGVPAR